MMTISFMVSDGGNVGTAPFNKQRRKNMDTKKLKDYLAKIAQFEMEKKEIDRDIAQVYQDAEKDGVPIISLKAAVKLSKMKRRDREALEEVADIID